MRLASDLLWVAAALFVFVGIASWSAWDDGKKGSGSLSNAYVAWMLAGLLVFVGLIVRAW